MSDKEPDLNIPGYPLTITTDWLNWKASQSKDSFAYSGAFQSAFEKLAEPYKEKLASFDNYEVKLTFFKDLHSQDKSYPDYTLAVFTDCCGFVLIEPIKSPPNHPNVITIAWIIWKYQQLTPNGETYKQLFRKTYFDSINEIAATLPDYDEDSIPSTEVKERNPKDPTSGYIVITLIQPFIEWSN